MKYFLIIGILIIPSNSNAQSNYQKGADVISWVTVISAISIDTYSSFHCPNKRICLIRQGIKDGAIIGSSELMKHFIDSPRPCARLNECGIDDPMKNMPSEHTALGFGSIPMNGQGHLSIELPLSIITGIGRHEARKHTVKAVIIGALLGSGIDFLTSKIHD